MSTHIRNIYRVMKMRRDFDNLPEVQEHLMTSARQALEAAIYQKMQSVAINQAIKALRDGTYEFSG